MKKGDVVQLIVIILALVVCLNSLQFLLGAGVGIIYAIAGQNFTLAAVTPAIVSILVTLLYASICWQLIVKSKSIADFIYEKTGMGNSFKIVSKPGDLLFILLIVLGFYFLVDELPALIKGLVNAFKTKASSRFGMDEYEQPTMWTNIVVRILLPLVLLMAARPIATYFAKDVQEEPVMIGEDIGDDYKNKITDN